jgi:phospholipid/cholesterol/gamma-HCH transport system substrate-binding protein
MAISAEERKKRLAYLKLGAFFLIGFLIFFITIMSVKDVPGFRGTYPLIVEFEFAEGLRPSSPVRFCGVDVGEVGRVIVKEKDTKPLVYVYTKIQKGVRIPRDSNFFVNSLSLFGEKYLEITPPVQVKAYLKKGEVVEGISPIPLFNVFSTFTKTMEEVRMFVKEGEIKDSVENTINNLEDITSSLKGLIEDMKEQKGTVGRLLYDDSLYELTEEFIADIRDNPWKLLHKPKEERRRR